MFPNIKGIVVLSFIIVIGLVACGGGDSSSGGGQTVADVSQGQAGEDGADPGGNDGPDGSGGASRECEYRLEMPCYTKYNDNDGIYESETITIVFGDGYCSEPELIWEEELKPILEYNDNSEGDIALWTEYAKHDIEQGCPSGSD